MITQEFVKTARKRLGMTQQALADRLGIHRHSIKNYEVGSCRAPGDVVLKIQQLLKEHEEAA